MMRILFSWRFRWAFATAVASLTMMGAAAAQTLPLPGGATLQLGQTGAATTVTLHRQGRVFQATLPPDDSIYAHALQTSTLIGAASDAYVVVSSDYESNPAGGTYQCGAGIETVVRVIALQPVPHQTFSRLVASCWLVVDAGDIEWDKEQQRLTIERTTYGSPASQGETGGLPDGVDHTLTIYQVASDGAVTVVSVKRLP